MAAVTVNAATADAIDAAAPIDTSAPIDSAPVAALAIEITKASEVSRRAQSFQQFSTCIMTCFTYFHLFVLTTSTKQLTGIQSQGQQHAAWAQPTPSIFPRSPPPSNRMMAATSRTLFAASA